MHLLMEFLEHPGVFGAMVQQDFDDYGTGIQASVGGQVGGGESASAQLALDEVAVVDQRAIQARFRLHGEIEISLAFGAEV